MNEVSIENSCFDTLLHDLSLDLINRLRAEIERLKDLNNQLEIDITNANMNLEHITYEFDLLEQEKAVVVSGAIKEFAERLKEEINIRPTHSNEQNKYVCFLIDNLVKEMVGENNEN
jgi:FtsZ-binding cell division protein ZapB